MFKKSGRLANEFSWSFSRHQTFSECQKKYWYTYYGSWEGWPKTPFDQRKSIDPLASYLYALKQMQQLPMFVGSCVHETIEHFLKEQKSKVKKEPLKLEELIQFADKRFEKGLSDSKSEAWRQAPKKHSNLFEHYYREERNKDPITDEMIRANKEKISHCLTNFSESPIVKMAFDKRASWISIEELGHFYLKERYKILVVIDFALKWRRPDGQDAYILFDWKTGQESEKTEEQLYSYALFANKVLNAPLDKIILSPFYLMLNTYHKIGYEQERKIDMGRLEELEGHIVKSCEEMASKLTTLTPSPEDPQPDPRLFPYAENRSLCTRCPFKEVCSKANYQEQSREELTKLVTI